MYEDYQNLIHRYPELLLLRQTDDSWMITGKFSFSARYHEKQINDDYELEILISSSYPNDVPKVREKGHRIPSDFHHSGEFLCLGEPGEVMCRFYEQPTLLGFAENCLIPYLYNFSHKEKFGGPLPLGELSHGWLGLLEHYQDLFGLKNEQVVLALLHICAKKSYRGHNRCPCGSKQRFRRCHGEVVRKTIHQIPDWLLRQEYAIILEGLGGSRTTWPTHR